MTTRQDSVTKDGKLYYSVAAAARLLGTTTQKVREKMGNGELEWTQVRMNGRLFVSAGSIAAHLHGHKTLRPSPTSGGS